SSGAWIFPEDLALGTAAYADTGVDPDEVPTNSDLPTFGTAAEANVQSSPSDTTAGAVLNNETTHIGGNENWTDANYQPETPQGVGVVRFLQNKSGAGHTPNQTGIAGSVLGIMFYNAVTGNIEYSGVTATGTYKQVDGINTNTNNAALYVRTA
ncbi:MAG: hypothetical protein GY799_24110, partial [Desulfobulbaceae bacterium]|nr:hypothetical protein [Desulfobulbaceae bacterium]